MIEHVSQLAEPRIELLKIKEISRKKYYSNKIKFCNWSDIRLVYVLYFTINMSHQKFPKKSQVLFVCTQNVFRSLSAEKLLDKYLLEKKDNRFEIHSAGTEAYPDNPYSYTLEKLEELGVKPFLHQQTRVSKEVLESQDIVICMTRSHQDFLQRNFGQKSYLFNELSCGEKSDLEDDVESSVCGSNQLENFVHGKVLKIHKAIPNIYKFIVKIGEKFLYL